MNDYKLLQLTNKRIGAQVVDSYLPLGNVTGRINCPCRLNGAICITNSGADTVVIGTCGHYKINYTASLVTSASSDLSVSLVIDGTVVYTTKILSVAGANNIDLNYEFKAKCDNTPINVQLQLGDSAITDGTSNTIIEKVY